jgi:hypothetical protein
LPRCPHGSGGSARRISKCPAAVLIVLCPDPAEAEKCRRPIRTGHPGFDLVPIVIDSSHTPGLASNAARQFLEAMMETGEYKRPSSTASTTMEKSRERPSPS